MRHPEITEWADYARELATDAERIALGSHLDEDCGLCRATLTAFRQVAETAASEMALTPPAGAIRSVKAFFAAQHPRAHGVWQEPRLHTAFDSALAPAAAASRAQPDGSRQLLFESEQYTLELSLDYSPGAVDAVVRGQILEAHGGPRSHTPVFLIGGGEVLDRTISEQHGTFELSGRMDKTCELWLFPDDDNRIRLSLGSEH